VLSVEIDGLKDPLADALQDLEKERESMAKELDRTKHTNRELVL
jgi:hypothetical protein